ncbi:TonB-dependent receptor [Alteromonadaceae bacterium M269]|nr:TonB-dependent receptor [Alteromonadaceae bacterium M269]
MRLSKLRGSTPLSELFKLNLLSSAVIGALLISSSAIAQENEEEQAADEEEAVEKIVVTGSRLKRSAFTSVSPIQIIGGEISRELGLLTATDILQQTTQATGQQINNTFSAFVLDNGTGAATVGFRGLGADRTLVLVNGRRLAPAGVGGAPGVADINLIPGLLIDSIENVFDGASAVYGSDAVAGVSNIKLKQEVEGFQLEATSSLPESGGGAENTIGFVFGDKGDKWRYSFGGEYFNRDRLSFGESSFFNGCEEILFEGPNGERFNNNESAFVGARIPGNGDSPCRVTANNRIIVPTFGSIYFTGGSSNIGIPNFSETTLPAAFAENFAPGNIVRFDSNGDGIVDDTDSFAVDGNGDGLVDVPFTNPLYNYQLSDLNQQRDLLSRLERVSVLVDGAYYFDDPNNTELFFEGSYARRDTPTFTGIPFPLFPIIPETNPFNPVGVNGVDLNNGLLGAAVRGPVTAQPVVRIQGDRQGSDNFVEQYRFTTGVRGDITGLDKFLGGNWSYDVYASYSRSNGEERFQGFNAERLELSINAIEDPNNPGQAICGVDADGDGVPDGTDGCVPVNFFAPSVYQANGGTFATQEEFDYLVTERLFRTEVEQTVFSGVLQGDLIEIPWTGETLPILIGAEHRIDSIDSDGNDVATQGLLQGFFSDQGASGTRDITELFVETALTLVQDVPFVKSLTLEAAGRLTDEEFSPLARTYSLKSRWQITDWLALRGTKGTSFRAPNLRERFLRGTTAFFNVSDPCVVPLDARVSDVTDPTVPETFDPTLDEREERVLNACRGAGLDPTTLGLDDGTGNGFNPFSNAEVASGGTTVSTEERSQSYTVGLVFDQTWWEGFDLRFSATYYDIEITDGIAEPGAGFIIGQCFDNEESPNGDGPFCDFITRSEDTQQIEFVNRPFINVGLETSKGVDFNTFYSKDFEFGFEKPVEFSFDTTATYIDEVFFDILGTTDNNAGEISNPRWRATGTINIRYGDFNLNWRTRWIQGGVVDNRTDFETNNFVCPIEGQLCRPISATSNYDVHNLSFSWNINDNYFVNVGVRNVFDTPPPRVDATDAFVRNTNPLGVGYDDIGRTYFATLRYKF